MTQPPTGGTRDRIYEVATEMFAVKGYTATSLRDIASAVGVEPASLYNHIESKEDLLFNIIKEASRAGRAYIQRAVAAAAPDPMERLRAACWASTAFHARHPHTARIGQYELHSLSPERRRLAIQDRDDWEWIFRDILQEGIDAGRFRRLPVTPTVTAIIALGAYTPLWFRDKRGLTPEQLADLYADFAVRSVLAETGQAEPKGVGSPAKGAATRRRRSG